MKDGGTREDQCLCAHCKQDTKGLGLLKIPTYETLNFKHTYAKIREILC